MDASPEIERILNRSTRSKYTMLPINGNMKTPIKINKKRYLISNTCAFDSVTTLITMAITDSKYYKELIDKSTNNFITFCNDLAKNGTSAIIYKKRLEMLKNIFMEEEGVTNVTLINAKCNVMYIVTSLLMDVPSSSEINICQDSICAMTSERKSATIIVRLSNGYESLESDLEVYTKGLSHNCTNCNNGVVQSTRILHEHIFIETDSYEEEAFLTDFPSEITVQKKR